MWLLPRLLLLLRRLKLLPLLRRPLLGGGLGDLLRPAGVAAPSLWGLDQHLLRFGFLLFRDGGLGDLLVDDSAPAWGILTNVSLVSIF